MSGGGNDLNKNGCASTTCMIFSVINLICKLIPIGCLGYLIVIAFDNYSPDLAQYLAMWLCVLLPLLWGLYIGIFGIKVSNSQETWENGRSLFKTLFFLMILGQIIIQLVLFYIASQCRGYGCLIFIYIFPAFWLDIVLQLANGIPIFYIWKDFKIAYE